MTAPPLPPPDMRYYTPNNRIDELQRDFVWMAAGVNGDEGELSEKVFSLSLSLFHSSSFGTNRSFLPFFLDSRRDDGD